MTASKALNEIVRLLTKSGSFLVEVKPSSVNGAGRGVFATENVPKDSVVCLYPGIYTPPLPAHASIDDGSHYVGNITAPSGGPISHNAYILNLQAVGGFLDGNALVGNDGRVLDRDSISCGHLVNHRSTSGANVRVLSFRWDSLPTLDASIIPNDTRCDGAPWYLDGNSGQMVRFDRSSTNNQRDLLCGAALYTCRPVRTGEELYLDYGLKPPYPPWAKDWYDAQ